MTLEEARELGFKTFKDMETYNVFDVREENKKALHALVQAGEATKAHFAWRAAEKEMKKERKERNFEKYILLPIEDKKELVECLEALRTLSQEFDGKVFNRNTTTEKLKDALRKEGYNCYLQVSESGALEITYYPPNRYFSMQDAYITSTENITYVNNGQVKPRLSHEALSHEIDMTIEGVEFEIEKLENAKKEEEIKKLNEEIIETRKKYEELQEKARQTYDEEAVKALYSVSYNFFHA